MNILYTVASVSVVILAILHLVQLVPSTQKRRHKRYLKRLIRGIYGGNEGIWAAQLRISALKTIREGVRRQLDQVSNGIKGIEDELVKKGEINKDFVNLIKSIDDVKFLMQPGMTEKEWREEYGDERRKVWNEGVKKILEGKHGVDRQVLEAEEKKKELNEIFNLVNTKCNLGIDAEVLDQQMRGKYIAREGTKVGGIDQEVKQVEDKIQGGLSLIAQARKERKNI